MIVFDVFPSELYWGDPYFGRYRYFVTGIDAAYSKPLLNIDISMPQGTILRWYFSFTTVPPWRPCGCLRWEHLQFVCIDSITDMAFSLRLLFKKMRNNMAIVRNIMVRS
jgi:hypothetical protein